MSWTWLRGNPLKIVFELSHIFSDYFYRNNQIIVEKIVSFLAKRSDEILIFAKRCDFAHF